MDLHKNVESLKNTAYVYIYIYVLYAYVYLRIYHVSIA